MDGQERKAITPGTKVAVVKKEDQRSGRLSEGIVDALLTKSKFHPHGIKVRLEDGTVGRVKKILD
ncbi:MAG: YwbE family protein [Bacillota bacterium]